MHFKRCWCNKICFLFWLPWNQLQKNIHRLPLTVCKLNQKLMIYSSENIFLITKNTQKFDNRRQQRAMYNEFVLIVSLRVWVKLICQCLCAKTGGVRSCSCDIRCTHFCRVKNLSHNKWVFASHKARYSKDIYSCLDALNTLCDKWNVISYNGF